MSQDNILQMTDISKSFPGVKALDNVSFTLKRGEIHALIGENGAGKSTIMKILTGLYRADEGTILFDGNTYTEFGLMQSKELGISMIYQELNLIPRLTVAENIFMGNEPRKGVFIDKTTMRSKASELVNSLGLKIPPDTLVEDLSVAYQQVVEIAKSITKNVKILIMDEPTAPLTNEEVEVLFKLVKSLKAKGVSIIYISHRLEEIFEICDSVTVFRDGKYIKTVKTGDTDKNQLIKDMVGRELKNLCPRIEIERGEAALEVRGMKSEKLKDVSLKIYRGEILGLGGLVGAGRTETVRAIFGADKTETGNIFDCNGNSVSISSPKDAIKKGIVLIPEDRKLQGLLLHMSVKDNMSMPNMDLLTSGGIIDKFKIKKAVEEYIDKLNVKTPTFDQIISNLSGGNQQKIVIAKWLFREADIIMFDEPTRGIDVGAKYEIYMLMNELKKMGKAIVMVSSEMEELVGMSDRILVMCEGRITGELKRNEIDQEKILWFASRTEDNEVENTAETAAAQIGGVYE